MRNSYKILLVFLVLGLFTFGYWNILGDYGVQDYWEFNSHMDKEDLIVVTGSSSDMIQNINSKESENG